MTVTARFHIRKGEFFLDVGFDIPDRGVTALLGPSGCGKTTLLRAISGLEYHENSYLKVGDDIWQSDDLFVPPHQRSLGYVFQEASLFSHLCVKKNLEYGLRRVPEDQRKVSLDRAIELLGIGHLLDRRPHTLSGGERQRVTIARALAVSPRLLLMDEPLSALDQSRKHEVIPYLDTLHNELEIPVIYVSHSPDEVARLANRLILLEQGGVKASGPINEVLTRLDLPLAHGGDAEALIEATVAAHDDEFDLTYLDFAGGRFTVTRKELPVGSEVRLRVAARDVSLTWELQTGTSILNIFPVTIDEITPEGSAQVTVRLLAKGVPMLSRVTRKSATMLNLKPGSQVYAQAKSVALLT